MASSQLLDGGGVPLWTPVTIFCASVRFQTTYETLTQFPETQLARLFSPPYPLFDEHNQAHMIPAVLCPDPSIFSCILEFLRTGHWLMAPDEELYEAVCAVAAMFEIPSKPPQLLRGTAKVFRYEHQTVQLPVPFKGRGGGGVAGGDDSASSPQRQMYAPLGVSPSSPRGFLGSSPGNSPSHSPRRTVSPPPPYDPMLNTATMLSLLGYKGFTVVAEDRGKSKFSTEITLRRKLPSVKGVEMLAEESALFQKLLNIV